MQKLRSRFRDPDGSKFGTLQSCIRTKDLELVGDGLHLTYFQMLGNFSFGNLDYENSVELWDSILKDLGIPVSHITVHPDRPGHQQMWKVRGYPIRLEPLCKWSDGQIGGHCCEVFVGDLEIGNLVNPLGHSTDVGFGWERLHMVVEKVGRIDQTSLFQKGLDPVVSDHLRTLEVMRECGIQPGSKGRNSVCRRLVRRILDRVEPRVTDFEDWLEEERSLREKNLKRASRKWRKFKGRGPDFWWETYGILPEEIPLLKSDG